MQMNIKTLCDFYNISHMVLYHTIFFTTKLTQFRTESRTCCAGVVFSGVDVASYPRCDEVLQIPSEDTSPTQESRSSRLPGRHDMQSEPTSPELTLPGRGYAGRIQTGRV